MIKKYLLLVCLFSSACTGYRPSPFESIFTGAVVGATAGAIAVAADASLDAGQTIGIGAAAGIPISLAFGALSLAYNDGYLFADTSRELDLETLKDNERLILENQKNIDIMRRNINEETPRMPNPWLRDTVYDGRTMGNWYR